MLGQDTCLFADLSRNLGAVLPRHVLAVDIHVIRRPLGRRRRRQRVRSVLGPVQPSISRLVRGEETENIISDSENRVSETEVGVYRQIFNVNGGMNGDTGSFEAGSRPIFCSGSVSENRI